MTIRLTQYSHGAGCGCKIAPQVLTEILQSRLERIDAPGLLVGYDSRDDAAVLDLGDGTAIISTTDFFMPIVDDPTIFGRIAATNAISDVYAMGGQPLMAIAILGWPVNVLPASVAAQVLDGGRMACHDAGIPLAGGHSIDAPEPIFGLAVTGRVSIENLRRNDTARPGDLLYLTKALGIGILTTALKRGLIDESGVKPAVDTMCQMNRSGQALAAIAGVHAMTDVTGFGLAGHLLEMCTPAGLVAELDAASLPLLPGVREAMTAGAIPGGTRRNLESYGARIFADDDQWLNLLADPQTSGGLLVAVAEEARNEVEQCLTAHGLPAIPIGHLVDRQTDSPGIRIR